MRNLSDHRANYLKNSHYYSAAQDLTKVVRHWLSYHSTVSLALQERLALDVSYAIFRHFKWHRQIAFQQLVVGYLAEQYALGQKQVLQVLNMALAVVDEDHVDSDLNVGILNSADGDFLRYTFLAIIGSSDLDLTCGDFLISPGLASAIVERIRGLLGQAGTSTGQRQAAMTDHPTINDIFEELIYEIEDQRKTIPWIIDLQNLGFALFQFEHLKEHVPAIFRVLLKMGRARGLGFAEFRKLLSDGRITNLDARELMAILEQVDLCYQIRDGRKTIFYLTEKAERLTARASAIQYLRQKGCDLSLIHGQCLIYQEAFVDALQLGQEPVRKQLFDFWREHCTSLAPRLWAKMIKKLAVTENHNEIFAPVVEALRESGAPGPFAGLGARGRLQALAPLTKADNIRQILGDVAKSSAHSQIKYAAQEVCAKLQLG